ncbi:hypothetical protein R3P38DRAFT_2580334 [Favolaschia claudopus]|uniref:BIR-domain-containing protein n=1 Tax=Favolaschia claudopus TaxID=2862362 RepID=A0AAV9ZEN6_9AGAR
MDVFQNRLNSFLKTKRGKSLKWPHPKTWKATPNNLAEAGFYFDPSPEDPDNVTCFMCDKQITEWAEEDDPFDLHFQKCATTCAWANLRCGLRRDADSHGKFVFPDKSRLPTSKAMEKARLETFTMFGWKHDKNKKHLASSKKMAHAGFVFTPAEPGDDTGACLYCHVALGNWDEDDDPMQHHQDRDKPDDPCPFLTLAFADSAAKQSKSTKRVPKPKPLAHTDILMPTKTYDGSDDDGPVRAPPSRAGTKTPRTVTRSVSKTISRRPDPSSEEENVTPPPKKRGRSKSRHKVSEDEQADERVESPAPTRKRRPTTTTRSRSKSAAPSAAELFDDDDVNEPDAPEPPRKTSRSRSKARDVNEEPPAESAAPKSSRSRAKAKVTEAEKEAPKRPPSRSQTNPPSEPPPDGDTSDDGWFVAALPPPPATTSTKPASRAKGKAADVDDPFPPPARSRTKSVSKPKGKAVETDSDVGSVAAPPAARSRTKSVSRPRGKDTDTEEPAPPPARSRTKSTRGKAAEAKTVEPDVVSRKEQKKKQVAETTETNRPPSRATAEPEARKPSSSRSKPSVNESKKPSSRAKTKPPPSGNTSQEEDANMDMEMEMEQYLPPTSTEQAQPSKSRSKPPSRVESVVEEPKPPRGRKPSSHSTTTKPALLPSKYQPQPTVPVVERLVEDGAAMPPTRTRKTSTRSTTAVPPVSRSTSTATKVVSKRDAPSAEPPEEEDVFMPQSEHQSVASAAPSRSDLKARSKPPSSRSGAQSSSKPKTPVPSVSPPPEKPPSTAQQKDVARSLDDEEVEGSASEEEPGGDLRIVDISTDDDEPRAAKTPAKAKGKGKGKAKAKAKETVKEKSVPPVAAAPKHPSPSPPPASQATEIDGVDDDVEMAEVEESVQLETGIDSLPATPPRTPAPPLNPADVDTDHPMTHTQQTSPEGFSFVPPLARDPFVNLESLTEAEQDMTVEEWIRYQMGIEYERFKRDGERQLGMFDVRAEEVRRAIETL